MRRIARPKRMRISGGITTHLGGHQPMRTQPMSHILVDSTNGGVHDSPLRVAAATCGQAKWGWEITRAAWQQRSRAMSWEFVMLVALLLWILWRVPVAWRTNMVLQRLWRQLNIIEAHVRHVPLEDVEKEWYGWEEDLLAARKGSSWWERLPWGPK